MCKKIVLFLMPVFLLLAMFSGGFIVHVVAQPAVIRVPTDYASIQGAVDATGLGSAAFSEVPMVYLQPWWCLEMEIGATFRMYVNVTHVTNLHNWEFGLYYENLVINATDVVEGPLLATGGSTHFKLCQLDNAYNTTHGFVRVNCTLVGVSEGVDGSGELATIIFQFVSVGGSSFIFSDTRLGDPSTNSIPHTRVGGELVLLSSSPVSPFKTFSVPWEGTDYKVATHSNSTVARLDINKSLNQISFYVNGIPGTTGFCNITIPKVLLRENFTHPWVVLIDDSETIYVKSENETHTSLCFVYTHSTHRVQIIGSEVIPEFPTALIVPLFIIMTLCTVILRRKK